MTAATKMSAGVCALALVVMLCGCGGSGGVSGPSVDTAGKPVKPPPEPLPEPDPASGTVYYFADGATPAALWRVNADATGNQAVPNTPPPDSGAYEVSPGPGPRFLIYNELIGWRGSTPVTNLMVVAEGVPLEEATNLTPSETVYSGDASICRHGDKIAFASGEAVWNETTQAWELVNWGIYVATLVDDDLDGLPDGLASKFKVCDWPASVGCYRISWAPGDDRLAFDDSVSPGPRPDVFVVDVQPDATAVNITSTGTLEEMAPEWSPDGSKIAFTRSVSDKKGRLLGYEIYTMNPDGSGLALAIGKSNTGYAWNLFPSWSQDGTQLVCRVSQAWLASGTDAVMRSAADGSTSAADLTGFEETDPTCIRWVW